jgi:hypothetical protein
MAGLFLVNHIDFSRAFERNPFKATPDSIAAWLMQNWIRKRGGGIWNYVPSMDVLVLAFAGQITLDQAIEHCAKYWHPTARIENERVVRAYWDYVQQNRSQVYKRAPLAAPVGRWKDRSIYIAIRAPLIRVADDDVLAVMPIFRKRYTPDDVETNLSMTSVREFCFREGYRDIDIELMRAHGIDGAVARRLVVERGSRRQLYTADEFDIFADKYAKGVAILANAGVGLENPNFEGYRVIDPDQPSMPGF